MNLEYNPAIYFLHLASTWSDPTFVTDAFNTVLL